MSKNKGTFTAAHLYDEQVEKLELVEERLDAMLGNNGRNRAAALRYIIDCFDPGLLEYFPKSPASARETA